MTDRGLGKNYKQILVIGVFFTSLGLSACVSTVWTGATLVYDRHHIYKAMSDLQLDANAHHVLFEDKFFKGCTLELAVINGDVLLAGHVPTQEMRRIAYQRIIDMGGFREFFKQVDVSDETNRGIQDAWITAKIRSRIFADSSINPKAFKILTVDNIVYVMGDVRPKEANKVLTIARNTNGVVRVVKLMRYYLLKKEISAH